MDKYIVKNFHTTQGKTCLTGVIRDILLSYGETVSEEMLIGLCSGWLFRFGYQKNEMNTYYSEMVDKNDLITIRDGIFDFNLLHEIIFEYTGFQVVKKRCNVNEMLSYTLATIDAGYIPIVSIITEELDYFPKALKSRNGHFVAVYGYDLIKGQIYIGDSMIPSPQPAFFNGKITIDTFKQSLDFSVDEGDGNGEIWYIEKKTNDKVDIKELIHKSIDRIVIQNEKETISFFGLGTINCGKVGIHRFEKDICNIIENFTDNDLSEKCTQAFGGIMSPGGVLRSRQQITEYFKLINKYIKIDLQQELCLLEQVQKDWKLIGNLLIRHSVADTNRETGKLRNLLEKVSSEEAETLLFLRRII